MYEKMMELLRHLLAQARAGKTDWEYLADDEMVRTRVGKASFGLDGRPEL